MLSVEFTNEPLRFLVASESGGDPYLVDLTIPACTCRDDEARCAPRRRAKAPFEVWPHKERTMCKHQTAALIHLGRMVVRKHAAQNPVKAS